MHKKLFLHQTGSSFPLAVAIVGVLFTLGSPSMVSAQTVIKETTITTTGVSTSSEIAAQELDLKEKLLEYEKTKIETQKSDVLDLRKAQLELEIKKLELLKARRDLMVQETQVQLAMQLEGDVLFDTNSATIKPGAMPKLKQVALILAEYPQGKVVVTGFADSTGTSQDNLVLSRKRAESVKTYLLDKSGAMISSERVMSQGMGEALPVATNDSSAGRQMNRRVEITVSKALGS
jgi:outer membrane protein OmpA-like peptidoglycan-associated protein